MPTPLGQRSGITAADEAVTDRDRMFDTLVERIADSVPAGNGAA
jgi:hypothetical protein